MHLVVNIENAALITLERLLFILCISSQFGCHTLRGVSFEFLNKGKCERGTDYSFKHSLQVEGDVGAGSRRTNSSRKTLQEASEIQADMDKDGFKNEVLQIMRMNDDGFLFNTLGEMHAVIGNIFWLLMFSWIASGKTLTKLKDEKGITIRFVIGRSLNHGDNSDRDIINENIKDNDFLILPGVMEREINEPVKNDSFLDEAREPKSTDVELQIVNQITRCRDVELQTV
ncbi:hypothetical protein L6452_08731 [Arctium lappa]|uniref:Uncharacterized protein n=1 Tax=Arctium lappa TaxID=4217 RepID=A0ACB9DI22_ARCLA|nr:hypothetical protein L6452_08731 [Arctium lappa]